MESQQGVKIAAIAAHTATVIFLHGLGQSNLTWKAVITEALASYLPHVEWVLPQAPRRPVTVSQGQLRPSWFDICRLPPATHEFDETAIAESINSIESLILEQVHRAVDPRRIVLVGFSQGAALSMMVALTTLHELGGVASLSGWIPRSARDHIIHTEPNLPIFWSHGTADREIPIELGRDSVAFLRNVAPYNLQFKTYEGLGHGINDEELDNLGSWLSSVLA